MPCVALNGRSRGTPAFRSCYPNRVIPSEGRRPKSRNPLLDHECRVPHISILRCGLIRAKSGVSRQLAGWGGKLEPPLGTPSLQAWPSNIEKAERGFSPWGTSLPVPYEIPTPFV